MRKQRLAERKNVFVALAGKPFAVLASHHIFQVLAMPLCKRADLFGSFHLFHHQTLFTCLVDTVFARLVVQALPQFGFRWP